MNSTSQTLAQRIAAGRIPVSEGLPIAMQLAEQLRVVHDSGSAHSGLSPAAVVVSGGSVALLPAETAPGWSTPYDAPELRQGGTADARSDVFSFGAVVFEMLTGRAFEAGMIAPLQSGNTAIDRLVNGCVAESPDRRYQRMPKVMLELRLLLSAARKSQVILTPPPVSAPPPPPPTIYTTPPAPDQSAMHAIQELEGRISSRLTEQERTIANVAHVANEVLRALREQQVAASTYAAPPRPMAAPVFEPEPQPTRGMGFRGYEEPASGSRADRMLDLLGDKLSRLDLLVSSAVDRLQKLETIFDQFDIDAAALRDSVTRDIRNFERALKSQSTAIESARTAMGQTDDLVERVVEAIDSLQSMFVNAAEERTLAS
jgi:eukaryotic-like serine/threonine-protein kinase